MITNEIIPVFHFQAKEGDVYYRLDEREIPRDTYLWSLTHSPMSEKRDVYHLDVTPEVMHMIHYSLTSDEPRLCPLEQWIRFAHEMEKMVFPDKYIHNYIPFPSLSHYQYLKTHHSSTLLISFETNHKMDLQARIAKGEHIHICPAFETLLGIEISHVPVSDTVCWSKALLSIDHKGDVILSSVQTREKYTLKTAYISGKEWKLSDYVSRIPSSSQD